MFCSRESRSDVVTTSVSVDEYAEQSLVGFRKKLRSLVRAQPIAPHDGVKFSNAQWHEV